MSAGGTKLPSKSLEYMVVNLALPPGPLAPEPLEGGLGRNIPEEETCLLLIALADLALSFASLAASSSFMLIGGSGGVSLAFAERDLGLPSRVLGLPSRVLGLLMGSAISAEEAMNLCRDLASVGNSEPLFLLPCKGSFSVGRMDHGFA